MLILTRRPKETICIGNDVKVTVLAISGNQIRIGVEAPKSVAVHREEVAIRIAREEAVAAKRAGAARREIGAAMWMCFGFAMTAISMLAKALPVLA